jgi:hypothetical protein
VCAVTYGVTGSADAELAALVAENLHVRHMLITPEKGFFDSFSDWTRKVIALSNGHATIDLAFQIYVYDRLSEHFPAVLDSAGCEFRRGIRGRLAAARAKCTHDISIFLTTMYATGIWNETMIDADFYHTHASATIGKLTDWLDTLQCATYRGLVDAFSTSELWAHHYAHGYPLQTNVIACRMPFSDNEFYDTLLAAVSDIRWSHRFHRGVIRRFAPSLERIAVSHGSCKVPYGESITRYVPLLYHGALSHLASTEPLSWLRSFDNYKPFRPYHHWYSNELEEYVSDTLSSATVREYVNPSGINDLLRRQHREPVDHSHGISILLTLVHLLEYARGFRGRRPEIC